MKDYIAKTHRILIQTVVLIITLSLALSFSVALQPPSNNAVMALNGFSFNTLIVATIILAFLCVPRLRYQAVVAPNMLSHIVVQAVVFISGAPFIVWLGVIALHAPLVNWLVPIEIVPILALGFGIIYLLVGVVGSLRAIWPIGYGHTEDPVNDLRKVHTATRKLSAVFAFAVSGIILGSIVILNGPTTVFTVTCASILLYCAVILGWSRFNLASILSPDRFWHIGPQLFVAAITALMIKGTTRAFLFHTGQFQSQSEIDLIYPRLENMLMLPIIVFGMTGIALALSRK